MTSPAAAGIEPLLRELTPQVLGAIARRYRDFAAAEDAVQEALADAAVQWKRDGLPDNPRGWLIHVAARRMTDHIRSETARRRREQAAVQDIPADAHVIPAPDSDDTMEGDDTLVLLFMCCHPALSPASAIALTLRAVGGLTTAEIASAFLVPEPTMAQRISRAKQTIKSSGEPFSMPATPKEKGRRLSAVLHVLYLIFNEGYTSSGGAELQRPDLAREAIRLARAVHRQLPANGDAAGLLALMLLTDARRGARTGPDGELIPLHEQDRTRWNRDLIAEGVALITRTLSSGSIGPYQLQAAIAAVHDEAARAEDTDWPQILALYDVLAQIAGSPIVELNRAVAAAMVHGAAKGLEIVDAIEAGGSLAGHHRVDAVRAHLLEMAGQYQTAIRHYLSAADRTTNVPERNYLITRAAEVRDVSHRNAAKPQPQGGAAAAAPAEGRSQAPKARNATDRRPPTGR